MQFAYLSFIEKLSNVFFTIFDKVFSPILGDILAVFMNLITNIIWTLLAELLLTLFATLCSLLDIVESIFDLFAGVSTVTVASTGKTLSLLDAFFQLDDIAFAFMCITAMSLVICFIFTIYKTVQSMSDMALEDKNPISKVMADCMKACVTFMLIPFLCITMLQLSTVVTRQATVAFNAVNGGDASIGTIVFLSASLDADKMSMKERDLLTGSISYVEENRGNLPSPGLDDVVRKAYLTGEKKYMDLKQVKNDFHAANFSYISGFVSVILLLLILVIAMITFIRRAFELLLLYIVSPFFVSTIPLDDGATFAKWRELFVAKFFSGFGTIFSMKFYMMLIPLISSSSLELYDITLPNGIMINNVLRIFFIIGGAWAVFKSQSLMLELLNPEAAQAEKQASALTTGMIIGAATTAASVATGGASAIAGAAMKGAAGAAASGASQERSASSSRSNDQNQAYRG